jgi:hypothetical protein
MAKFHIPIDPNPECFSSLGEVAARWGWIENQLSVLIRELMRLKKPESNIAIHSLPTQRKIEVLKTLGRYAYPDEPIGTEIVALGNALSSFNDFRNDVVHGLWVDWPTKGGQLALVRRVSLQQKVDPEADRDAPKQFKSRIEKLKELQETAQRITTALKGRKKRK